MSEPAAPSPARLDWLRRPDTVLSPLCASRLHFAVTIPGCASRWREAEARRALCAAAHKGSTRPCNTGPSSFAVR